MDYKKRIAAVIRIDGASEAEIYNGLNKIVEDGLGDYCLPCFRYAKLLGKNPVLIAEDIVCDIEKRSVECPDDFAFIEKVKAVKGYVNFFLSKKEFISSVLAKVQAKGENFEALPFNGKTVCIEFSSVNIAKPFHIGHLLTTVIGGSLHRIYSYLGYKTVAINHLGDWGTQFGKMITAYLKWGQEIQKDDITIDFASKLYQRFHEEAEKDDSLNDEARAWFRKLEDGDPKALELFKSFKEVTLRGIKKVYNKLNVRFDSYKGESFFKNKSREAAEFLRKMNLLTMSDGAEIVSLEEDKLPPCLIFKSDGTTLYATRDLAAAIYRKEQYNFDKSLYIVAYQQDLHFKQVFKVLEKMGYEWAKDCIHVPFGMVSIEGEGSLSTRKGTIVYLKDVIETSVNKAESIIEAKNPRLSSKKSVALAVGVGAVVFSALSNSRIKDVSFSYDRALNFEGETSAYIQYTHARCCSLISKAQKAFSDIEYKNIDFDALSSEEAFEVAKLLNEYDNVAADAAEKYEPSFISRYLIDLSQKYNKFYMENRIITDNKQTTTARLYLTYCVKNTLKNGLSLLLIKAPERM